MLLYFPKVFSKSTYTTFSFPSFGNIHQITNKLNYALNSNKKILKEWYDNGNNSSGKPFLEYFYK